MSDGPIVPPISLDSSLATLPGGLGEEPRTAGRVRRLGLAASGPCRRFGSEWVDDFVGIGNLQPNG